MATEAAPRLGMQMPPATWARRQCTIGDAIRNAAKQLRLRAANKLTIEAEQMLQLVHRALLKPPLDLFKLPPRHRRQKHHLSAPGAAAIAAGRRAEGHALRCDGLTRDGAQSGGHMLAISPQPARARPNSVSGPAAGDETAATDASAGASTARGVQHDDLGGSTQGAFYLKDPTAGGLRWRRGVTSGQPWRRGRSICGAIPASLLHGALAEQRAPCGGAVASELSKGPLRKVGVDSAADCLRGMSVCATGFNQQFVALLPQPEPWAFHPVGILRTAPGSCPTRRSSYESVGANARPRSAGATLARGGALLERVELVQATARLRNILCVLGQDAEDVLVIGPRFRVVGRVPRLLCELSVNRPAAHPDFVPRGWVEVGGTRGQDCVDVAEGRRVLAQRHGAMRPVEQRTATQLPLWQRRDHFSESRGSFSVGQPARLQRRCHSVQTSLRLGLGGKIHGAAANLGDVAPKVSRLDFRRGRFRIGDPAGLQRHSRISGPFVGLGRNGNDV
mmetsp:Transcript_33693/g.93050  ORF Transcript_33693/g.93050 Transcript_33693/m.93050 type:complete len:506 (+) Transcript_33693:199-1716(+)